MGAVWSSEPSKNLIMSILLKDFLKDIYDILILIVSFL
jgi:BirA family biotin operon repressor/biotin-[acetyl-CoA-carboxylase] ligase